MNGKRLAIDFDQEVAGVFVRPLTRVAIIVYSMIIPLHSVMSRWDFIRSLQTNQGSKFLSL
jgi:hypothetical protein